MIFAMFLFCISDTRSKFALRNIFIFAIVSFMASVMAVGRGGIISTAFLLIITLLMLFKGSSLQKRILLTLFSFVGIYFLMMNIDYVLDVYLVRFTNQ
ncbi:TPA: hypothetical protein ACHVIE_002317, partial [Streptococcus suis]